MTRAVVLAAALAGCGGLVIVDLDSDQASASSSGQPPPVDAGPPDPPPDAGPDAPPPFTSCAIDADCANQFPSSWCYERTCVQWTSDFARAGSPHSQFMCEGSTGMVPEDESIYCPDGCCMSHAAYAADSDLESYAFSGDDGAWTHDNTIEMRFVAPTSSPMFVYKIDIRGGYEYVASCFDAPTATWIPFVQHGAPGVPTNIDQPGEGVSTSALPAGCVDPPGHVQIRNRMNGNDAQPGTEEIKLYEATVQ